MSAMDAGSLAEKMGIEIVSASAQQVVATMPVAGNTQPYGLLHGGASAVLAETVGSVAAMIHARETTGGIAVGVELNATHHRAAIAGVVTAVATAVHRGGTMASYQVIITDEHDKRICTARLSCLIRAKPPTD